MVIAVSEEKTVDYELTARIATEAFGSSEVVFAADRMKWLYERGFGQGSIVLAATDDGVKIGQVVLVHQTIQCDGEPCPAIQLIDLFVAKDHRSPQLIRRLYKEMEQLCLARNARFILAVPNENARPLNARLLKLQPLLWLPIRAGVALMPPLSRLKYSGYVKSLTRQAAVDLLSAYRTPADENGLRWDGEVLFDRLSDPTCDYAVHAAADLLLISSSRRTRGVSYTLLCGFFARPSATVTSAPSANWSAPPATSGSVRCSLTPASMTGCQRFPEFRCRRGCGLRCWFSCATWLPESPRCDWIAFS